MGVSDARRLAQGARVADVACAQQLTAISASVASDGDKATFNVTCEGYPLALKVSYAFMGIVAHEVRTAARLMVHRQRLKLDKGVEAMLELCATALRPTSIEFIIEPNTGDHLIYIQFQENSPLVLRMTTEEIMASIQKVQESIARSTN